MDKADAEKLANALLSRYTLPEDQRVSSFIGEQVIYGVPRGGEIVTRQAAEGLLKKINEHPEKVLARYNDVQFVAKRAWIEGDEEAGKLMVEYERSKQ